MKVKTLRDSNIEVLLRYVNRLRSEDVGTIAPIQIAGTVFGSLAQQIAYFKAASRLRSTIRRCFFHFAISPTKNDTIDDHRLGQIAQEFMALMGFPLDTPYVAKKHTDSKYVHFHIVACRVSFSGHLYDGDAARPLSQVAMDVVERLERRFGLEVTISWRQRRGRQQVEPIRSLPHRSDPYRIEAERMQSEILEALEEAFDWEDLNALLNDRGISIRHTDRGVSYGRRYKVKASALGAAFMSAGLAARGLLPVVEMTDDWGRSDDLVFSAEPIALVKPFASIPARHVNGPCFAADDVQELFEQAILSANENLKTVGAPVAVGTLCESDPAHATDDSIDRDVHRDAGGTRPSDDTDCETDVPGA